MGGLSMLLLAGEHALTAQEVRISLFHITRSFQFKKSSEGKYLSDGRQNLRYFMGNLRWN